MKILLDTNILISAALFPHSNARIFFEQIVSDQDRDVIICEYTIAELYEVFHRKFPQKVDFLSEFLKEIKAAIQIVSTPDQPIATEVELRDPKDQPILRAAMAAHVDLIITGDKDLLEAGLEYPKAVTMTEYSTICRPNS